MTPPLMVAIDEAGSMNRGDLCSISGNTLLLCLLAGDEKQLAPVVMTMEDLYLDGNSVNRSGPDGRVLTLDDVDSTYGTGSDNSLPGHRIGHILEEYVRAKFLEVKPPQDGNLEPVFNFDHIHAALDFCADFVQAKKVKPVDLLILSPYDAMVEILPGWLKRPEYAALEGMRPPSIIDSIQGQEGGMVVVITGTNEHVGAGFTSDERRLNVMLSRHKSALVIFSDIDTVDVPGKGKLAVTEGLSGEMTFSKATTLKAVHSMMVRNGRIATVNCI
ncbi:hypothetical protein ACHAQC_008789 [Fusarium culmorum]